MLERLMKLQDVDNDRDIYEDITKKIRFDMYKKICEKHNCVIALGHNKDDCIENIFANIAKQQKMIILKGMKILWLKIILQLFVQC